MPLNRRQTRSCTTQPFGNPFWRPLLSTGLVCHYFFVVWASYHGVTDKKRLSQCRLYSTTSDFTMSYTGDRLQHMSRTWDFQRLKCFESWQQFVVSMNIYLIKQNDFENGWHATPGQYQAYVDMLNSKERILCLQRSESAHCGVVVIITHAPSVRYTCEAHEGYLRAIYCTTDLQTWLQGV